MNKAKGPVWHKRDKAKNRIPERLHGVDRDATWGVSNADGWVYGHGTFCLATHGIPILGLFYWMPNSADESKYMQVEVTNYSGLLARVCMDSKADSQDIFYSLKEYFGIKLITSPKKKGKLLKPDRANMLKSILSPISKRIYKERSVIVEPMQSLIKDIFELDVCWMRGSSGNRWLFAAMGIAIQIAQWNAYLEGRSTWAIKSDVLGV